MNYINPFDNLPKELYGIIFVNLGQPDIANSRLVCKKWSQLCIHNKNSALCTINQNSIDDYREYQKIKLKNIEMVQQFAMQVVINLSAWMDNEKNKGSLFLLQKGSISLISCFISPVVELIALIEHFIKFIFHLFKLSKVPEDPRIHAIKIILASSQLVICLITSIVLIILFPLHFLRSDDEEESAFFMSFWHFPRNTLSPISSLIEFDSNIERISQSIVNEFQHIYSLEKRTLRTEPFDKQRISITDEYGCEWLVKVKKDWFDIEEITVRHPFLEKKFELEPRYVKMIKRHIKNLAIP